jgi:hypothetical protein
MGWDFWGKNGGGVDGVVDWGRVFFWELFWNMGMGSWYGIGVWGSGVGIDWATVIRMDAIRKMQRENCFCRGQRFAFVRRSGCIVLYSLACQMTRFMIAYVSCSFHLPRDIGFPIEL